MRSSVTWAGGLCGSSATLCVAGELHQGIDSHDAVAGAPHDQRIAPGPGDGGIVGEPRKRHDRTPEPVEVALGPAAIARERKKSSYLGDHLLRLGEIDRRQLQAAVARDLGEETAG